MKNIKNERGQSLVELAVSLVLLLVLLSGAVEFGIAFFQFVQLRDAAQEGALYGSMNPYIDQNGDRKFNMGEPVNQVGIENRARNASYSPIDLKNDTTNVTVVVSSADGSNKFCEGYGLKVEIVYQHKIFMPFLPSILGRSTLPLRASVTDTILTPVCP